MSKKIKILSLILFFIIIINTKVLATTQGVITGDTVKLRSGAGLDYKLVTLLSVNDKVEVLEKSGDWYKVTYKEKTGYVFKDYIKVDGEVQEEGKTTEETTTENTVSDNNEQNQKQESVDEPQQTEQVTNNNFQLPAIKQISTETAKMYILPLVNSSVLMVIQKDTKVTATEIVGEWVYISSDSISGWIRKDNLKDYSEGTVHNATVEPEKEEEKQKNEEQEPKQQPETEQSKTKIGYVNVDTVHLRKEANITSEILDDCVKNQEVTIISESNNWCKVTANGKDGYIAKKYLSDTKVETTSRSSDTERKVKEEVASEATQVSNKGEDIVNYAKQYLGVKYVSGGGTPSGFDCSGFTSYVYKNFGYSLSRSSVGQASNGVEVAKSNLQLGDIVVFNNSSNSKIGHVGIYIGGNQFIHASSPGDVVKITSLSTSYYDTRYVTSRRIIQ